MRIGAAEMLSALGLLRVVAVMNPTSFQHRGLVFLLPTEASVILSFKLCIGEAARAFDG
jgi:hypothetical protein